MHVLKYCRFFDNFFDLGNAKKRDTNNSWKPTIFDLVFSQII